MLLINYYKNAIISVSTVFSRKISPVFPIGKAGGSRYLEPLDSRYLHHFIEAYQR